MADLEITGGNNNSTQKVARGQGGETRTPGEDRHTRVDASFTALTEMIRPRLAHKALAPRTELVLKWLRLSLGESLESLRDYAIKIGSVSKEQGYNVKYPGVLVAVNRKGSNRVVVHTLLIHDGMDLEVLGKPVIYQHEDITPVPTPNLVFDEIYEEHVKAEIFEMFGTDTREAKGIQDIKFASMGCTILPKGLEIPTFPENASNDHNVLDPLYVQIVESLTAFEAFLSRDKTRTEIGRAFKKYDQIIKANVDQVPAIEFDTVGNPRRSDFCISLELKDRAKTDTSAPRSYNEAQNVESATILRVTGYVLPYYTKPDPKEAMPQNFGVNIVVTDISGESTPSLELFLYGLASTSILASNDMWVDGFKPQVISATPNRNLGSLFLDIMDANREPMERRTYSATAADDLLDDVDFLFSDRIKISLDCAESGPLSWITEKFFWNEHTDLVEAANNLTANKYDDIADNTAVIDKKETRRFYTGYAETENGLMDIREVDYLYLINAFREDESLDLAYQWDLSINENSDVGLAKRKEIIEHVYGHGRYKITGFVDRVVINPEFYEDLVDALDAARMLPQFDDYSKNNRPRARLEAKDVGGTMSSRDISSPYRSTGGRGFSRGVSGYRSRD